MLSLSLKAITVHIVVAINPATMSRKWSLFQKDGIFLLLLSLQPETT